MSPKHSPTVLVVEDDEPLRGLIGRALAKAGYKTLLASDAEEAGNLWAGNKDSIGLLIADIVTPGLSGPELAREFTQGKPNLKVIFISGERRDAALEMTSLVKDAAFLSKPFPVEKLLQTVQNKLSSK